MRGLFRSYRQQLLMAFVVFLTNLLVHFVLVASILCEQVVDVAKLVRILSSVNILHELSYYFKCGLTLLRRRLRRRAART